MTWNKKASIGRKAESIYTAMMKNLSEHKRKDRAAATRHSISSFEEHMKRYAASHRLNL